MEAVRQFRAEAGSRYVALCHLAYIPYIKAAGEIKTKPAQHSVQKLREIGLIPDFLLCRAEERLNKDVREKLALFCNVDLDQVIELPDATHSIYEVPITLLKQNMTTQLAKRLDLADRECDMRDWDIMLRYIRSPKDEITIGLVGKYIHHQDAYKSVTEATSQGPHLLKVHIERIEAGDLEGSQLAPSSLALRRHRRTGGFGSRGVEGKIKAIEHVRTKGIPRPAPGMQMACTSTRNVLGWKDAHSHEMDGKTEHPIIVLMESQKAVMQLGGTMRLGAYPCTIMRKARSSAARMAKNWPNAIATATSSTTTSVTTSKKPACTSPVSTCPIRTTRARWSRSWS